MKKSIVILALCIGTMPLSIAAQAADRQTEVTFSADPSYTVIIPEKVVLQKTLDPTGTVTYENDEQSVSVEKVRIGSEESLMITLTSDYHLDVDGTMYYSLPYTVRAGDKAVTADDDLVAVYSTKQEKQETPLYFAAEDPVFAGTYTDTVVFNISIKQELI